MAKTTASMTSGKGMRSRDPASIPRKDGSEMLWDVAPVRMRFTPLTIPIVPRVTMKGAILSRAISSPFNRPTRTPQAMLARIQTARGTFAMRSKAETVPAIP